MHVCGIERERSLKRFDKEAVGQGPGGGTLLLGSARCLERLVLYGG